MFKAVDGNGFPGLNHKKNNNKELTLWLQPKIQHNHVCMSGANPSLLLIHMMLAVGAAVASYPAGGDCVLKHTADCGSQSP